MRELVRDVEYGMAGWLIQYVDTIVFGSFMYIYMYNLYACENLQGMVVEVRYTFYNMTHPDRLFVNK